MASRPGQARLPGPAAACAAALLLAACGTVTPSGSSPSSPTAAASPGLASLPAPSSTASGSDALATVAGALGDDTTIVEVTDWAHIRGATPAPDDSAARLTLAKRLFDRAGGQTFAGQVFAGHRAAWGWDSLDLAWEGLIVGQGDTPVWMLAFPAGFDFGPLVDHLNERGFTREQRGSARVFSHPLDLTASWARTTDLAIVNTAIVDDRHLIIASRSREMLEALLDRLATPTGSSRRDGFEAVIGRLGPIDGAVVDLDRRDCAGLALRPDPSAQSALAGLHPWTALGFGWSGEPSPPTTRVVLTYPDAAGAAADLAARVAIAGSSSFLDVTGSKTDGDAEVIDVSITTGPANGVLRAFYGASLDLAGCPAT